MTQTKYRKKPVDPHALHGRTPEEGLQRSRHPMFPRPLCVINRCGRPQGIGTWCSVVGMDEPQPVCEEHWQVLRDIFPVEAPSA